MGICKLWFWALLGGSCVYGDLQHWSAVLGLVWCEPCLWGFASFGRQFWASPLWARLVGAVWGFAWLPPFGEEPVSMGQSLQIQFWASFGGMGITANQSVWSCMDTDFPPLAVMGLVWWEPCLWGFAVLGLVWWEPCLWGIGSSGPRLVGAVSVAICSDGPRLVGAVSMGICSFGRQ